MTYLEKAIRNLGGCNLPIATDAANRIAELEQQLAALHKTCPTCHGAGGWESAASSTSYFWKVCPDCKQVEESK